MERNRAAQNLAFAIGGAGVSANDIVKRSDYATEAEFLVALGQTQQALESPGVRAGILKAKAEERERAAAEERKKERERIRERAENWKLTPEQIDEIHSRATEDAAKEYAAGKLDPRKTLAARQRELAAEYEKKERNRLAAHEAANQAIRDAWRKPTAADLEFTDRVINPPVADPDA